MIKIVLAIWERFVLLEFTDTDSKKLLLYILKGFHFIINKCKLKTWRTFSTCLFFFNILFYVNKKKPKFVHIFFHALIRILQSRLIIELNMEISKFSTLLTVNDKGLLQRNLDLV